MRIRTFLFICICLIVFFVPVTFAVAQDNLPNCLIPLSTGPSQSLKNCLSSEDDQRLFGGKKVEDVWVNFGKSSEAGKILLLNSHKEALQEYDKIIAEKRSDFQRYINLEHDKINAQDLNIGSKSTFLSFMQTTGFFGIGGERAEGYNTEGVGWTLIPSSSITAFVQDNCLVYFGGRVSLHGYGNNYVNYHKLERQGQSWQAISTHPNFDHGKQYLVDQSTELAKIFSRNIKGKCSKAPQKENTQQTQNPDSVQDNSLPDEQQPVDISKYTQALVIEPPKESDFQKVSKFDFKQVNPVGTESANLTGTTFTGKVGGEGELILQLPDGKEVKLTDDKSAFGGLREGLRPDLFRWRDIIGTGRNYIAPKRSVFIKEIDCQILLEQERQRQEDLKRPGGIRYASEWGVDETIIIKSTGDCSYTNEGGPIRVLTEQGQVTFKTPDGTSVSADNADFGIGYNAKSSVSIVEVYNGSITITNMAGNSKTISATYGSEIKQIEVNKDEVISERIAIPQSQWQAFLVRVSKQEKKEEPKENTLPIAGAVAVLVLGGIVFFLYRTGKLMQLYQIASQKITESRKIPCGRDRRALESNLKQFQLF
ncbi:hypothetical protein HYU93_03175 [Candidatus Daviesbacteria bacterium]|nr:hypothetical protein [Candidatus Daviesbacteria bacterium]